MPPKKAAAGPAKGQASIMSMFASAPKRAKPAEAKPADENKKPSPERAMTPTPVKARGAEVQEAPNSRSSPRLRTAPRKDYAEAAASDDDDDDSEMEVRRRRAAPRGRVDRVDRSRSVGARRESRPPPPHT